MDSPVPTPASTSWSEVGEGAVGKGAAAWGPLQLWGGHQDDKTKKGAQCGPPKGITISATTKKLLQVHSEGVKAWAVVWVKGEEGGEDGRRQGKVSISLRGRVKFYYNDDPPPIPCATTCTGQMGQALSLRDSRQPVKSGRSVNHTGTISWLSVSQLSVSRAGIQRWFVVADNGR